MRVYLGRWKPYLPDWLTLVSAALIVFAFPPWKIEFLIWVALVPWFHSVFHARNWRHALAKGAWLSFFMTAFGFYWIAYVLKNFGQVPWAVAIGMFCIYAPFAQLQFSTFAMLGRAVMRWELSHETSPGRLLLSVAGLALSYTGIDWLLPKLFQDSFGHALFQNESLRQLAAEGGVWLLTSLILFVNLLVFVVYRRLRMRREMSFWPEMRLLAPTLLVAAAVLTGGYLVGNRELIRVRQLLSGSEGTVPTLQAGIVQANIGDIEKLAAETGLRGASRRVLDLHFEMSQRLLGLVPKPHFIVWPETSYPSTFRTPETPDEESRDKQLEAEVRRWDVPLFFGGYDQDRFQRKDYNAFFFLLPRARENFVKQDANSMVDLEVYRKNILLLFGEYIPGADQFDWIRKTFPQVGNFGRGGGPRALEVPIHHPERPLLKLSPLICYEVLFPSYTLPAVRDGAEILLNVTNDSWFGPTAEPELHLALATFRAIETRRPLVRSTNTGISAVVQPDGRISERGGLFREEILNFQVPLVGKQFGPRSTRILAWGDWFGPVALVLGLAFLGLLARSLRGRVSLS